MIKNYYEIKIKKKINFDIMKVNIYCLKFNLYYLIEVIF